MLIQYSIIQYFLDIVAEIVFMTYYYIHDSMLDTNKFFRKKNRFLFSV